MVRDLTIRAALVVIAEHVGHLVVTANIVKKDLVRDRFCTALCSLTDYRRSFPVSISAPRRIPPIWENIGTSWRSPAFTVHGLSAARFRHSAFLCCAEAGGGDSRLSVTRDGRRLAAVVCGVIGASRVRVLIESKSTTTKRKT